MLYILNFPRMLKAHMNVVTIAFQCFQDASLKTYSLKYREQVG